MNSCTQVLAKTTLRRYHAVAKDDPSPAFLTSDVQPLQENGPDKGRIACLEFPPDYQIIALAPLDPADHGVAISKQRCEIVYWNQENLDPF